jgi:3-hydroxyisobutyrate dehydrogenase
VFAFDAPVSGGDIGAKNATLTIMVGGDAEKFDSIKPLLDLLGKTVVLQGGAGAGQHTKMANQIAVAANLLGAIESLSYAQAAGLDPHTVLRSIGGGSAASWQLTTVIPRILDGNFSPGFYSKHFRKDLSIALDSAKKMAIKLPLLDLAHSLYVRIQNSGLGDAGTQILYQLYQKGLV